MGGPWLDWVQTPRTGIHLECSAGGHGPHDVLAVSLLLRVWVTYRVEGPVWTLPLARTMMTTHGLHCASTRAGDDNAEKLTWPR